MATNVLCTISALAPSKASSRARKRRIIIVISLFRTRDPLPSTRFHRERINPSHREHLPDRNREILNPTQRKPYTDPSRLDFRRCKGTLWNRDEGTNPDPFWKSKKKRIFFSFFRSFSPFFYFLVLEDRFFHRSSAHV